MLKYARYFLVFTAILFHVVCVVCVCVQMFLRPLVRVSASEALLARLSLSMRCHLAENWELRKTTVCVLSLHAHYSSEMEATSTSIGSVSTTHILRFSLSK